MLTPRDVLLDRLRSRDVSAITDVVTTHSAALYHAARGLGFAIL